MLCYDLSYFSIAVTGVRPMECLSVMCHASYWISYVSKRDVEFVHAPLHLSINYSALQYTGYNQEFAATEPMLY